MSTKNNTLQIWLWKWHVIAGLISLPFVLVLAITGAIYLFKSDYEAPQKCAMQQVQIRGNAMTLEAQWALAKAHKLFKPDALILPTAQNHAVEFVSGRFGSKTSIFIDPYQGVVTGMDVPADSLMYKVRKLHGELLMGSFGTKMVELVASWMIVLILTGLYIWWPSKIWNIKGFLIPRYRAGRRVLYRDVHAITGFWISILLLMTLAGGMPWTDVFGANFKGLQKATNTGYPSGWHGRQWQSEPNGSPMTLDAMVARVSALGMPGRVRIDLPKGPLGVYSVGNMNPSALETQQKYHFDQYTGKLLRSYDWKAVGILMRARMWFMAFHQGEFGRWNWVVMLVVALGLLVLSAAALASYFSRKQKHGWSIPQVPEHFRLDYGVLILLGLLALVFPLFGISALLIGVCEKVRRRPKKGAH